MKPTLLPGDLLVVKADEHHLSNAIVIASVNSADFAVKRYDAEARVLYSDNPEYPQIPLKEEDKLIILGYVKCLIRDVV